ncbi:MAG: phosphatase PAP2 family protein [Armatimonadetes bacterium]|nr:phosphatase PAP2 family protein [Armatimonadota bacterium]
MYRSLLIAVATVAVTVALMPFDPALSRAAQSIAPGNETLHWLAEASEHVLNPVLVLAGALVYTALNRVDRARRFWILMGTVVVQSALVNVMKDFFGRMRPDDLMASFAFHGPWDLGYNAFPGGHAAGSFALATVFSAWYPRWRWALYTCAVLITLARIYLGRHFVSDCVIGAALGYWVARTFLHYLAPRPGSPAPEPAATLEV